MLGLLIQCFGILARIRRRAASSTIPEAMPRPESFMPTPSLCVSTALGGTPVGVAHEVFAVELVFNCSVARQGRQRAINHAGAHRGAGEAWPRPYVRQGRCRGEAMPRPYPATRSVVYHPRGHASPGVIHANTVVVRINRAGRDTRRRRARSLRGGTRFQLLGGTSRTITRHQPRGGAPGCGRGMASPVSGDAQRRLPSPRPCLARSHSCQHRRCVYQPGWAGHP